MVLIDMDKPKECQECPLILHYDRCIFMSQDECDSYETWFDMYRHCPLKKVQE